MQIRMKALTVLTVYRSSCGQQYVRVSQLRLPDDGCKSQTQLRVRSLLIEARCAT